METLARELVRVAATMVESTLDGMRNDRARRHVSQLMRQVTGGRHRDTAWRPVSQIARVFNSMGFDWDMAKPSRYWASDFWKEHLRSIDGANSPADHKTWEWDVSFENNRGRPTVLRVRVTANAIGPVGAGDDVWDVYDMDFSVG